MNVGRDLTMEELMRNLLIPICLIATTAVASTEPRIQLYKDIRSGQSSLLQHPDYLTERRASVVLIAGNEDGYFSVKFKTSTAAVLCVNPFDLKEAVAALTDEAWLKSLNCWSVPAGIDVIKIEPVENSQTEPWKVRLRLPNGTGATLWGYIFSFTLPNGNRITY
jgi:hypothetical protein